MSVSPLFKNETRTQKSQMLISLHCFKEIYLGYNTAAFLYVRKKNRQGENPGSWTFALLITRQSSSQSSESFQAIVFRVGQPRTKVTWVICMVPSATWWGVGRCAKKKPWLQWPNARDKFTKATTAGIFEEMVWSCWRVTPSGYKRG